MSGCFGSFLMPRPFQFLVQVKQPARDGDRIIAGVRRGGRLLQDHERCVEKLVHNGLGHSFHGPFLVVGDAVQRAKGLVQFALADILHLLAKVHDGRHGIKGTFPLEVGLDLLRSRALRPFSASFALPSVLTSTLL